jgi:hypothetical protein
MQGIFVSYDLGTEFVSHVLNGEGVGKMRKLNQLNPKAFQFIRRINNT